VESVGKSFPILVVDDDPVSRTLLEKILKKEGFTVITAQDGKEALELFRRHYIPIIITDWVMPNMDGIELCKTIRSMESPGYVYLIMVTSNRSDKDDIVKALESGADDYISKPFYMPELLARIKTGIRILELERSLKEANEKIKRLSITDPLTGCYNRLYLNEHLPREIKRAIRYRLPLSISMADIDHFKKVNDTYGHQAGDEVLKVFSKTIKSLIRDGVDWIARFGGEEFVIVLPETEIEGAKAAIERIRKKIENTPIETGEYVINITSSFGVACFDPKRKKDISADRLINEADRMLYEAKREGRNRVKAVLI